MTSIESNNTGDTNRVGFVKDDLTTTTLWIYLVLHLHKVTLDVRYISGIPITIQDPFLTLAGAELYRNGLDKLTETLHNPFEIASGTNDESTPSSVILTQYKNYATLDGASHLFD